jgi:hypothetical protein
MSEFKVLPKEEGYQHLNMNKLGGHWTILKGMRAFCYSILNIDIGMAVIYSPKSQVPDRSSITYVHM